MTLEIGLGQNNKGFDQVMRDSASDGKKLLPAEEEIVR